MTIDWIINEPIVPDMVFSPLFTSSGLLIQIDGIYPPTWTKCGTLIVQAFIEGQLFNYTSAEIKFQSRLLNVGINSFKLKFNPAGWTNTTFQPNIKIAPYNFQELLMISPGNYTPPVAGSDVPVSVPASINNVSLLPANPLRLDGYILNTSNRVLWVNFTGVAATAGFPNTPIPANNGSVRIPNGYVGAISGIWQGASPTLNAQIHEFSQA